jgi:hypothetical protein
MTTRRAVLFIGLLALMLAFTPALRPAAAQGAGKNDLSVPAAQHRPEVLVKWMQLLYDRAETESISAPAAARLYAYAGVTAYQAVLPGVPEGLSLSGQLSGLADMPAVETDQQYDWPSSANGAFTTVIAALFPNSKETKTAVESLSADIQKSRERQVKPEVVKRSTAYGVEVGKVILEWVAGDNFAETRDKPYELPTGDPSYWLPTAPGMKPVEPYWGSIRPFALYSADACAQKHNMPFATEKTSTFYLQALEVKNVGDKLTPEQKDIARYWVDTPGQTGTPAGHWVLIQNQITTLLDLKLDRAAMMYALVNIALGDSFISAWELKYKVLLLRPVTYINQYIDPRWKPFIESPGFPEYPSGHSVVSGAAAEVLTTMFGAVAFTDRSGRKHGFKDRAFTSFEAAASEAAISRLYGGIHYREAIENGLRQGRCIGQNVLSYVTLRSVPQGE